MNRILIVEDDLTLAYCWSEYLQKFGHEVRVVDSGMMAIVELQSSDWSVVITDMSMVGGSGVLVISFIAQRMDPDQLIVVSGYFGDNLDLESTPERYRKAIELFGVRRRLKKPFSLEELGREVDSALMGAGSLLRSASTASRSPAQNKKQGASQ